MVGAYLDKYFVPAFQKVGTFRIVGKNKQGGNVASYFCAPDGRVLHVVTYDPPAAQGDNDALTYRDPTGRPLAPVLPPPPIDGPDVKLRNQLEQAGKFAGGAGGLGMPAGGLALVKDRKGQGWALNNQGRAHQLLAAHAMVKIENVYASVFEGILGERVSTRPVEIVHPFPWYQRANLEGAVRN